jgi:FMN phosphatase YigB (HAD superfamily)
LPAERALHVGDSETNDLRGAQKAGLNALLVDRSLPENGPVEDRIASLQEIVSRIDR